VIRSDFEATRLAVAREARICSRFRHDNVLRVFEVQSAGAFWVVLMELVQGEQLGKAGMSLVEFRRCFAALADAVATLGERGVVHRDIKPANILRRREDGSPVLVDFGLAVDLEALEPGDTAGICGTPLFMAPEAFERGVRPTPAWDVYSLGITALNVLLGKINSPTTLDTLWESKRSGQFQNLLSQSLEKVRDPELREWVRLLTEPDPSRRAAGLMMAREWAGE
jgi:serine/threonine protein kinase